MPVSVPQTIILTRPEIRELITPRQAIAAVEEAFAAYARGAAQMPPKMYLSLKQFNGDFRAMPSYLEGRDACAIKWVNVHPDNARKGLPTVMAVIILSDPGTGFPVAIMDGTHLTAVRTAAAGAVAAKYLARKNSRTLALIGCGAQAPFQLELLRAIFKFKMVRVWGPVEAQKADFVRRMTIKGEAMLACDSPERCVEGADIIVTTTPSRKPVLRAAWIAPGTHINAIGADAPGKEELDPAILKKAKVVIDDWEQASHSGEINVPVARGLLKRKDIYAQIGDVVVGRKKSRVNDQDITVFDSTGLAIQDAAVAQVVYQAAVKKKIGLKIRLF